MACRWSPQLGLETISFIQLPLVEAGIEATSVDCRAVYSILMD